MTHLRHIRSEAEYDSLVALMNSLLDAAGDVEDHPLSGLLELVGDLVSKYEQTHYAIESPGQPIGNSAGETKDQRDAGG